jgi:hypothetical protein
MRSGQLVHRRFRSRDRSETADVSLAVTVLYWGGAGTYQPYGPTLSAARTRSAKPASNRRRICAQKILCLIRLRIRARFLKRVRYACWK